MSEEIEDWVKQAIDDLKRGIVTEEETFGDIFEKMLSNNLPLGSVYVELEPDERKLFKQFLIRKGYHFWQEVRDPKTKRFIGTNRWHRYPGEEGCVLPVFLPAKGRKGERNAT